MVEAPSVAPSLFAGLHSSLSNFSGGAPRGISLHRFGQVYSRGQIFQPSISSSDAPAATQRPVPENFFFDGVVVSSGGAQVAEGGAAIAEGEAAAVGAEPPAPEAVPVVPPGVEFGQEPWRALLVATEAEEWMMQQAKAASLRLLIDDEGLHSSSSCDYPAVVSSGGAQETSSSCDCAPPADASNEPALEHSDSEPAEVHLEPSLAATEAAEDASNVPTVEPSLSG